MGLRGIGGGVGKGAKGRHIPRAKFSPVGEYRRKHGADFARSELEKAVTGASRERIMETAGETGVQGRPLVHRTKGETTVRCENRSKRVRMQTSPASEVET